MLENTQLHEKIAEAINNAMTSETLNNELNATISSVVEQTQSDPVFQRLVDEMFTLPPGK
jgi:DNA-binding FadR family transcriptional regulator